MGSNYPAADPSENVRNCPECGSRLRRVRTENTAGETLRGKRCTGCSHGWLK